MQVAMTSGSARHGRRCLSHRSGENWGPGPDMINPVSHSQQNSFEMYVLYRQMYSCVAIGSQLLTRTTTSQASLYVSSCLSTSSFLVESTAEKNKAEPG